MLHLPQINREWAPRTLRNPVSSVGFNKVRSETCSCLSQTPSHYFGSGLVLQWPTGTPRWQQKEVQEHPSQRAPTRNCEVPECPGWQEREPRWSVIWGEVGVFLFQEG